MREAQSKFFIVASLILLAAGVYLAFTYSVRAPTAAWLETYPYAAFSLAVVAGFADGLNPCAITTLLLFIAALMAIVDQSCDERETRRARLNVWSVAGAYILGIFVLYFFLGMGFVEVTSIRIFGNTHVFTRLAGFIAVILGLVMVAEYVFPNNPIKLGMPASLHSLAHKWGRKTTMGAAFIGGIVIGLCTIPCGGAMYLAVAAVIGGLSSKVYAYALLTSYNLAFILPLVLLVGLSSSRPVLLKISRLHVTHRGLVKLVLGIFVMLVGFFALL